MAILPQPQGLQQLVRLLSKFAPAGSCLLCGADAGASVLCAPCTDDLPLPSPACCPQCGEATTHGERCGACLKHAPHFDSTCALLSYDFPADRLIQTLKYGHQLAIADWLGERLAERLAGSNFDIIVPMPLHPRRLRDRGFNQAVEIARPIARRLERPLEPDLLERIRATAPQAELALKDRHGNVRGAFECRADLRGRHVLLIDDVMTSGATLDECARILKLHAAERVGVAVAARALKH